MGARIPHPKASLAATEHDLSQETRQRLDEVSAPELGSPYGIFTPQMVSGISGGGRPTRWLRP
ncbi:MAG: hypothetical protein ABI360_01495 [Allobranchiibius sp.]